MASGSQHDVWIPMSDDTRLAATLYLPADQAPVPVLLEALPYRKDDLTSGYRHDYLRFRDEHGFAVCRVDLRGTGSSQGVATDEYPEQEQVDLVEVIAWLAEQSWSSGSVGMFGTSWSGFNSIQVAMRRPPALKAICASYASDDRWTDDVHYYGGALRLIDQVDYPLYMVAMNALPPVPAVYGYGWREEWAARLAGTPPWQLDWLRQQRRDPYWRHGSLRPDYESIEAATLLADGYRNNSLRTAQALQAAGTPVHVLAGPWSHQAPSRAYPGPRADHVPFLAEWFNTWLRPGTSSTRFDAERPELTLFVRRWSQPSPDAEEWVGEWRSESILSLIGRTAIQLFELSQGLVGPSQFADARSDEWTTVSHDPDLGLAAWNSCAAALPWGLPTDQRWDDSRALTLDFVIAEHTTVIGYPNMSLRILPEREIGHVGVRLCAVSADSGTSILISRGLLALSYRDGLTGATELRPTPVAPGNPVDVSIDLEMTAYTFVPGETLRVSISATEWPNAVASPGPARFGVDLTASRLALPVVDGTSEFPVPELLIPGSREESSDDEFGSHVKWWTENDVLARETVAAVEHGSSYPAPHSVTCSEKYRGRVSIDRRTWDQGLQASTTFEIDWPELTVRSTSELELIVNDTSFDVKLALTVHEINSAGATEIRHEEVWQESIPRDLA
jgi:predicted acyl esterase